MSRLAATMVLAVCCSFLNCSDWRETRLVTSSRLPAISAVSTPSDPIRSERSPTRRTASPAGLLTGEGVGSGATAVLAAMVSLGTIRF